VEKPLEGEEALWRQVLMATQYRSKLPIKWDNSVSQSFAGGRVEEEEKKKKDEAEMI
jgi:hypothetical protein